MPNKISKSLINSLLLVMSIICFTFGVLTMSEGNLPNTVFPEETDPASAGQQVILKMNSAVCIPDAIVNTRENNTGSNTNEILEISRRFNNKQSIIITLLMLFIYTAALMLLRLQHGIEKTIRADMPVLALSLGGNSPPVIHA